MTPGQPSELVLNNPRADSQAFWGCSCIPLCTVLLATFWGVLK